MTDLIQEPTRLLDDPELDAELRHDLEIASNHAPLAYSVEAGFARFEQTIHGATTMPPGGSVSGLRVLGWFLGAALLLGGVGSLLAGVLADEPNDGEAIEVAHASASSTSVRTEDEPVAVPRSSDAHEPAASQLGRESVAEAGVADGVGDAGPAPTQAEGDNPALDAPAPPRSTSKSSEPREPDSDPDPDSADSLANEAAQIAAARKALTGDPGKALALMQAAEQQFPNGAMIQERRGYTILALVALGRTAEAEAAGDAYLERWPNGTLSRRVRDALGR